MKKTIFSILISVFLPMPALLGQQIAHPEDEVIGQEGMGEANILNPEDMPVPAGRRGDCGALKGPNGALSSATVLTAEEGASYTTCLGWDDKGNPSAVVDPAGFLTEMEFDLLQRPTSVHDPLGEILEYFYDPQSRIRQMTQSNNFNPNGDPANRAVELEYDSIGNVVRRQITGGDGTRQHYTPDETTKAMVGPDNALGSVLEYNSYGLPGSAGTGIIDAQGNASQEVLGRTRYEYDASGRVTAILDGSGRRTAFRYDDLGRVRETVFADNSSVFVQYDDAGRVRKREGKDRSGNVLSRVEIDYDNMSRPVEMRTTKPGDINTWKVTWAYRINGTAVDVTYFWNNVRYASETKNYDALGRLNNSTAPGAGTVSAAYDSAGRLERITHSATGLAQRYQYDAKGRLQFVRDGLDNLYGYQYNGLGNLSNTFRPMGNPTQIQYDANGRPLNSSTGEVRSNFSYDEAGRLRGGDFGDMYPGFMNAYQRETGLLASTAIQGQTTYQILERDASGQVTRAVDAGEVEFSFYYDTLGRLLQIAAEKDGGLQYRNFSYYGDGRVKGIGESVALPADRFAEMSGPANHSQNIALRAVNRLLGRLTYDNRLKSVVWFAYDGAGNLREESRWIQGRWLTTTVQYSASQDALWTTFVYPSGFRMERRSDAAGRLVVANGRLANGNFAGKAALDYAAGSPRLERIRFGNNESRESYVYDPSGRITRVSVFSTSAGRPERKLGEIDYKYSPLGTLIAEKEWISPVANQNLVKAFTFGYDDLGRLKSWSGASAEQVDGVANNGRNAPENAAAIQRFWLTPRGDRTRISTHDPNGTLTGGHLLKSFSYSLRMDGVPQSATRNLCSFTEGGSFGQCEPNDSPVDVAFDPDPNGNLQSARAGNAAGPTYVYNLFGQLVEVNDPAANNRRIQYYYDALGRVISRQVWENQRVVADQQFVWDGARLSEVRNITSRNRSGEVSREDTIRYLYGFGSSDVLASYDGRSTRYHHSHPDGSTFLLTLGGNVNQWFAYSPFGETRVLDWIQGRETQRPFANTLSLRLFGGAMVDPLTGFYFLGSWYDPVHGHGF